LPGKLISGSREDAESQVHSMINSWLEKNPRSN
jgi:hypothetical protein